MLLVLLGFHKAQDGLCQGQALPMASRPADTSDPFLSSGHFTFKSLAQNAKNYSLSTLASHNLCQASKNIFPTKLSKTHSTVTTKFKDGYIGMFPLLLTEHQLPLSMSNSTSPQNLDCLLKYSLFVILLNNYLLSTYYVAGIGMGAGRSSDDKICSVPVLMGLRKQ